MDSSSRGPAVAIVGMSGRFPKSPTLREFWSHLRDGDECLTRFTDEELAAEGVPRELRENPQYVPVRGVIDGRDLFDAGFFGINPREAELTDPQQRLLLECAWEALEDAGYDPERLSGPVGVYAGVAMNTYLIGQVLGAPALRHPGAAYQAFIGNDKDFCATRISYKLGLRGPSMNVQTACSTALVAVHLACQSLLTYQCDMALVGVAAVSNGHAFGYLYEEGMINSPDGHCRAFDAAAGGTVGGEAVAFIVLKRLDDARADRDTVRAVILGTGVNNDGSLKAGYTAPSVDGQCEAIVIAQSMARVDPDSISMIEAHGTGTPLGDPIEVAALTRAFREQTARTGFCALGSVKTNIGHTDPAAGLAGLIKTVLALEHRQIPPSLHFTRPNPALDLERSPFYVNATLTEWPEGETPRRAGVSSFGIGGTNAHVVIEQAPPVEPLPASAGWQVLPLSARLAAALDEMTTRLAGHLRENAHVDVADVAFTLQEGRRPFEFRRTVVCRTREEAAEALASADPKRVQSGRAGGHGADVAFMFSGQGAQYPGMGSGLYADEPVFREAVDTCSELLTPHLGRDLKDVLFPAAGQDGEAAAVLTSTEWAQPALFTLEYALARLWIARGVQPAAMIGHSIGEYVAATLAGVFQLEDVLPLVALRGRLMQQMPAGSMLVVPLSEEDAVAVLPSGVVVAAINGPNLIVASGPTTAIDDLEARLTARGISPRRLHTSHAFHSPMMEPVLTPFRDAVARVTLESPAIPFVSNLTGEWITPAEATSPDYWASHLRRAVRFAAGVQTLVANQAPALLEVGPGRALASLARLQAGVGATVLTSLRHPEESRADAEVLAQATAHLWRLGVPVAWSAVRGEAPRRRVPLPTYPFERARFWLEAARTPAAPAATSGRPPKRSDVASWFYAPSWTRTPPPVRRGPGTAGAIRDGLVFTDDSPFAKRLVGALVDAGYRMTTVRPGAAFADQDGTEYVIRTSSFEDYVRLFAALARRKRTPGHIVHLWAASRTDDRRADGGAADRLLELGHLSLMGIAQGLGEHGPTGDCRIVVVTDRVHDVMDDDRVSPLPASLQAICRVIPQEHSGVHCANVDVDLSADDEAGAGAVVEEILGEIDAGDGEPVVAWRHGRRWVERFEPSRRAAPAAEAVPLKERGVYLVTGGLGGVGLVLAEYLAGAVHARLALVSRTVLPPREQWDERIAGAVDGDWTAAAIRNIRALEARGAEVLLASADVADAAAMARVVADVRERFGDVNGVIHAAGLAGGRLIELSDVATSTETLRPKIQGTRALARALGGQTPDWIVLCSSLSAVFTNPGDADYAAANAFLDGYAEVHDSPGGTRVISIGWDTWQQVGMAADAKVPRRLEEAKRQHLQHGLTNAEAVEVLRRVLATPAPRVLILTQGYDALRAWLAGPIQAETRTDTLPGVEVAAEPAAASTHERPGLSTEYVAPTSDLERQIAGMWESLLGVSGVGIHDNFFELGGHSLLATQLISRIRDAFAIQLPLRTIFDASTVAALASHVSGILWVVESSSATDDSGREEVEL